MCDKPDTNATEKPKEYECYSCGQYKPMDWDNLQRWTDQLEPCEGFVCDDCLRRGWHGWGRAS